METNKQTQDPICDGFYTEDQIVEIFDISKPTAEDWRKRHKGPPYACIGNRFFYPKAGVVEFIEMRVKSKEDSKATPSTKELL